MTIIVTSVLKSEGSFNSLRAQITLCSFYFAVFIRIFFGMKLVEEAWRNKIYSQQTSVTKMRKIIIAFSFKLGVFHVGWGQEFGDDIYSGHESWSWDHLELLGDLPALTWSEAQELMTSFVCKQLHAVNLKLPSFSKIFLSFNVCCTKKLRWKTFDDIQLLFYFYFQRMEKYKKCK